MDIREQIKGCIEREGRTPWALAFDDKKGSPEALSIWASLNVVEKLMLSRFNSYRNERNQVIYELYKKGVHLRVLCELSGFKDSGMKRILARQKCKEND